MPAPVQLRHAAVARLRAVPTCVVPIRSNGRAQSLHRRAAALASVNDVEPGVQMRYSQKLRDEEKECNLERPSRLHALELVAQYVVRYQNSTRFPTQCARYLASTGPRAGEASWSCPNRFHQAKPAF